MHIPYDPSRQDPCDPDDYKTIEYIGSGSYGTVYKAIKDNKYFAVKTHRNINTYAGDQIRFRFINELLMLSSKALLILRSDNSNTDSYVIQLEDWFKSPTILGFFVYKRV